MFLVPLGPLAPAFSTFSASTRLSGLEACGSNPGNLLAWHYRPPKRTVASPALVVVLHGCTQTAATFDRGSGWSELAAENGFAVLFPEQQRSNNMNLCFNWFEPADTHRGMGEAMSIAQMVEHLIERKGIDRERIFITGLSAGGAMTSAMLAAYPDLFAGGAILAGLPSGAAATVVEALQQMSAHTPSQETTGSAIRTASAHSGRWPRVSVWHGTADTVVSPSNADAISRQWREVHGLAESAAVKTVTDGHRIWSDERGKVLVEEYRIAGMGHGMPLATTGECGCGEAGAFMLEAGISSTLRSAESWGLLRGASKPVPKRGNSTRSAQGKGLVQPAESPKPMAPVQLVAQVSARENRIAEVINKALRAAGLLK